MELNEEVTPYIQGVISVLSDIAYILLPPVLYINKGSVLSTSLII